MRQRVFSAWDIQAWRLPAYLALDSMKQEGGLIQISNLKESVALTCPRVLTGSARIINFER